MTKIDWHTDTYELVGQYRISRATNLVNDYNQQTGFKRNLSLKYILKKTLWPILELHNNLLVDGFIKRLTVNLINKYLTDKSTILDIGCGDISLSKYTPKEMWYNGLDILLSDYKIIRAFKFRQNINLVLASATDIPASSNSASLIVSTETFEHIPEINRVMEEIYRVITPDGVLICSIPNNYCYKYKKKGAHSGHINNWTYHEFIEYMESHHFYLIEGFMKGKWIPFPLWLTRTSYQLPISSKQEFLNTNFFYVFRVNK